MTHSDCRGERSLGPAPCPVYGPGRAPDPCAGEGRVEPVLGSRTGTSSCPDEVAQRGRRRPMSRRGWVLFLTMSVIWGIPYLLIKVAVDEVSPVLVVFARCVVGAALLLPWTIFRGQLRPVLRHWRALLL